MACQCCCIWYCCCAIGGGSRGTSTPDTNGAKPLPAATGPNYRDCAAFISANGPFTQVYSDPYTSAGETAHKWTGVLTESNDNTQNLIFVCTYLGGDKWSYTTQQADAIDNPVGKPFSGTNLNDEQVIADLKGGNQ